jgi:hypothetical protein
MLDHESLEKVSPRFATTGRERKRPSMGFTATEIQGTGWDRSPPGKKMHERTLRAKYGNSTVLFFAGIISQPADIMNQ